MIFILSALCWRRIRGLRKLPDRRDSLWRRLGLVLMGGPMLSKSLVQFSVDGQGCVPSLLFDVRPNYGGAAEDDGDLLPKVPCTHCHTQCPRPYSGPLSTHASPRDSWTLTDTSGSVSCGVTALSPGSWCTRFCLCPPRVCFPLLGKFCNQTPLASKVKFCGSSRSFCQIPRLGNLLWVLEISQQCENSSGIIVLQFVGHLLSGSMVGLMVTSSKRT